MADNRKFLVKINDIGKGLFVHGKFVRTPVEFITIEKKLEQLLIEINIRNISDYDFILYDEKEVHPPQVSNQEYIKPNISEEPKIEELNLENLSTLERLMRTTKKE